MTQPAHPNSPVNPNPTPFNSLRRWWWAPLALAALVVGIAALGGSDSSPSLAAGNLVAVSRGPLSIRINSTGAIRSGESIVIKNKVEGRATVLWIIEEGSEVNEGDKLLELDSSALRDEQLEEEIEVETSRAAHTNALLTLEIVKQQGQADIEAAEVAYRLALLDLEKYAGIDAAHYERLRESGDSLVDPQDGSVLAQLNQLAPSAARDEQRREAFTRLLEQVQGTYKQEVKKALNAIIIADAEAQRARDQFDGSAKLFEKGYITETELEADRLDFQKTQLDLDVAAGELELLVRFTYKRTMEELLSAVSQMRFALEKARNEAEANIVDAQANLNARRERLVGDEQNLAEINAQIEACTIFAPQAGMVVYGTTGRNLRDSEEPLAEGVEVREQMDLFRLPTSNGLVADLKVHESLLDKISVGLPVQITSDAVPGRAFNGRISRIAFLPDAQSAWLNPDLKVYDTTVQLLGDTTGLRTGMSCRAEIIVHEFDDTLAIPIQTVVRVGRHPTVYVADPTGGLQPRQIQIGLDDNQMIQVLSGLNEGELVSLAPPLAEGQRPLREPRAPPQPNPSEAAGPPGSPDSPDSASGSADDENDDDDDERRDNRNRGQGRGGNNRDND